MTLTDSKHPKILLSVFVIVSPTKFFHTRIDIIYVVLPNAFEFVSGVLLMSIKIRTI